MRKHIKRVLAWSLAVALLLCCMPGITLAADLVDSGHSSGDDYSCYWELDSEGTLWIYGSGNLKSSSWGSHRDEIKKVVIGPDYVKDDFHALGDTLFYNYPNLTSVEICDTVRSIGRNAFGLCPQLTEVKLPASLETIDSLAFSDCEALTTIELPEGASSIGESAFSNCTALTSVTLPASLTSIGASAFKYCESLASIALPAGITKVSDSLFFYCSSLSQVTLPEGLTEIGEGAFMYCQSLTELELPDTVQTIGKNAFYDCGKLAKINIPQSVTSIGVLAFNRCFSLEEFSVPDTLTYVGAGAFGDTGLKEFHVGLGLQDVTNIFNGCRSLTTITVAQGHTKYATDEQGILYNKDMSTLIYCPGGKEGTVTVPGRTKTIGENAFSTCAKLTGVVLGEGVETISDFAFSGCYELASISLPNSLKSIGKNGIRVNSETITIPANVKSIGNNGIFGFNLKKYIVDEANPYFMGTEDGLLIQKNSKTIIALADGFKGILTIPEGVTEIPYQFLGDSGVTEVILPDSVTTVEGYAFANRNLQTITLPAGVTVLNFGLFDNCHNLKEVYILGDITKIDGLIFNGCESLERVYFAISKEKVDALLENIAYLGPLAEAEIIYDYVPGPACKHEIETVPGKEPTCAEDGLTEGKACILCGKVFQAQETIDRTREHTVVAAPDVEPTCTQEGSIGGLICSVCGQWIADPDEYLPMVEHTWVSEPLREPTCSQEGIAYGGLFCSVCGWIEESPEIIPPLSHIWNEVAPKEPTCTEDGWKAHFSDCENCGEPFPEPSFTKEIIPALGHSWNEGVVTKEPTAYAEGVKTYTCASCGETKTESIPMLDHTHAYTQTVTAPSCTEQGYTTHTCSCGDSFVDTYVDATGHRFGQWLIEMEPENGVGLKCHACDKCGEVEGEEFDMPLTDIPNGKYYSKPVFWAYENGITKGKTATEFQKDVECTRKQIVMFLWRAAGQPQPKSMKCSFTDVKADSFQKAILWAVEKGITAGTGDGTTFSPDAPCTRKQIVMFLWRYFGKPALTEEQQAHNFTDMPGGQFRTAILWALHNGITTGKTATTFNPDGTCTRGEIVTFLYRAMVES